MSIIDDFEDGTVSVDSADWSDWTGDLNLFDAQQSTAISGDYSGRFETLNSELAAVETIRDETGYGVLSFKFQISERNESADYVYFTINDTVNHRLTVEHSGGIIFGAPGDRTTILSSWSAGTTYDVTIQSNTSTGEFEVSVNNTTEQVSVDDPVISELYILNNGNYGSSGWYTYLDDIEFITQLNPPSVAITSATADSITLDWTAQDGAETYEIYRATSPGEGTLSNYTLVDSTPSPPYSDMDLLDGTRYHYVVRGYNGISYSDPSDEVDDITNLPAPTGLGVDDVRDDAADVEWTANHDNGETRVEVSEDDDGSWSTDQTVSHDTQQATIDDLLHGQLYGVRVVAQTDDTETEGV